MHAQSINTTNTSRYSRLPPCGHLANTDTPMLRTLGKSPVETIIATIWQNLYAVPNNLYCSTLVTAETLEVSW